MIAFFLIKYYMGCATAMAQLAGSKLELSLFLNFFKHCLVLIVKAVRRKMVDAHKEFTFAVGTFTSKIKCIH